MKFILLSDYYHPIVKSGSIVIGDLAKSLTELGHSITIVTFCSKQKKSFSVNDEEGIRVIRIRTRIREYGMIGRLITEIRYSRKIISILKKLDDHHFHGIICLSPSIFYGKCIKWMKNEYNVKAYLVCRDIFPKWALDSGLLKDGPLYRFFKYVERRLYESVDIVGIESKSDSEYFLKELPKRKIEVLNNWGSPANNVQKNKTPVLNKNKVNILYGGNMAEAQNLLGLLTCIDLSVLGDKAELTLIGNGHQLGEIENLIQKKKMYQIKILPEVEQPVYLAILEEADIGLVSLNKKLNSNNYPLKMMGYLQNGKPILASVNDGNEIIDLINKYEVGLTSIAEDSDQLNRNLRLMIEDEGLRKIQGSNGIRLFEDKFTVKAATNQILSHF